MDLHARLRQLDLVLPPQTRALAAYVPTVRTGTHIYVSGQLPMIAGEISATGRVPSQIPLEQAQGAARQCTLNALAAVNEEISGDWSMFSRVIRLGVFVNSDPDFREQHRVANGASDVLRQIFGPTGRHVRSAVGVCALPLGAAVELEMVVEIHNT